MHTIHGLIAHTPPEGRLKAASNQEQRLAHVHAHPGPKHCVPAVWPGGLPSSAPSGVSLQRGACAITCKAGAVRTPY
eukprot:scaffold216001_cov31-Tisochrysis_lutea.AAC.2